MICMLKCIKLNFIKYFKGPILVVQVINFKKQNLLFHQYLFDQFMYFINIQKMLQLSAINLLSYLNLLKKFSQLVNKEWKYFLCAKRSKFRIILLFYWFLQ